MRKWMRDKKWRHFWEYYWWKKSAGGLWEQHVIYVSADGLKLITAWFPVPKATGKAGCVWEVEEKCSKCNQRITTHLLTDVEAANLRNAKKSKDYGIDGRLGEEFWKTTEARLLREKSALAHDGKGTPNPYSCRNGLHKTSPTAAPDIQYKHCLLCGDRVNKEQVPPEDQPVRTKKGGTKQ